MPRDYRRVVVTPGKSKKRFVAGALNAATGRVTLAEAKSKASDLFCKLVSALATEYRKAKRLHLVVDSYIIHSSKMTQHFLVQFGDREALHFLPPYCPNNNQIERVWLDPHANVTRNHRCKSIEELMVHVFPFFRGYNRSEKLNPSLRLATAVPVRDRSHLRCLFCRGTRYVVICRQLLLEYLCPIVSMLPHPP
jgi:transposase